jgi:DNA gyrase/topoisomerase IV subunit B
MLRVYAKHACDISATANVKVFFNRKMIDCTGENGMGILKYGQLYFPDSGIASMGLTSSSHILYQSSDSMCLMVDTPNAGITVSFVNGVINEEGGVHVDAWKKALFKPIIEHLKGKVKGLNIQVKEKDISEHISMILICRLINPKYRA